MVQSQLPLKSLVFDIEGNGLLPEVTKVHCIGAIDTDTGHQFSWGPNEIQDALDVLYQADVLTAHFGISYDFPALRKVCRWNPRPGCRRQDTVVMSRLFHPNIGDEDAKRTNFPPKLKGKHSLKSWGIRLGEHKGEFGVDENGESIPGIWDHWCPEMQSYMDQDVVVNHRLLQYLKPWDYPQVPLDLEYRAAEVCSNIEQDGWPFDIQAAQDLYSTLVEKRDAIERNLRERFGSWQEVDKVLIPKRDDKKRGYVTGVPVTKYKTVTFNPGSRQHIAKKLTEAGWTPEEFTPSGQPKLDEEIISKIDITEAADIVQYLLIQKRIGQLGDGDNAWLRLVGSDERMHGQYNPCGTVTGRSTHYSPNISQVPSVSAPYGEECRALFKVPTGWKLVGADMAGLELRTFAHYLAAFDRGEYAKIVTSGDPHWFHTTALGLYPVGTAYDPDNAGHKAARNKKSKRWIYAWLYGAAPPKLSTILNVSVGESRASSDRFLKRIPAIAKLKKAVETACKRGWVKGLDGRRLHVRSAHSALNTLLQAAGAVLCKRWLCDFSDAMSARGYRRGWNGDYVIVGWIHDEIQVAVREGMEVSTGSLLVELARSSGADYGLNVELDSSYVVGNNWRDTH